MLIWFAASAVVVVLFVFDSPAVDYRWVAAGGVLPLIEALTGSPWIMHTLLGSVLLLAAVMAATVGKRLQRRAWLGLPIGSFVFLVVSGVWSRTDLFWWPFAGFDAIGQGPPPEFDRPLGLLLATELLAIAVVGFLGYRLGLFEPENRAQFVRTGRVPRDRLR